MNTSLGRAFRGAGVAGVAVVVFFGLWAGLAWPIEPENVGTFVRVAVTAIACALPVGATLGLVAGRVRTWRTLKLAGLALAAVPAVAALTVLVLGAPVGAGVGFALALAALSGLVTVPLAALAGITLAWWIRPEAT